MCPPTALRVISYDSTLLPVENLTASSEDIEFNPVILLFGRNNVPFNLWCSDSDTGLDHHINVSFTQPVVITLMISSGFSNGYVSNFTVEYMEDNQSDFTFYEDSQEGKVTFCLGNNTHTLLHYLYINSGEFRGVFMKTLALFDVRL